MLSQNRDVIFDEAKLFLATHKHLLISHDKFYFPTHLHVMQLTLFSPLEIGSYIYIATVFVK